MKKNSINTFQLIHLQEQEYNRKTALRIYSEIKAAGTNQLTPAQLNDISSVANQCPLSGGKSVYLARALYRLNEDKQFDDGAVCGRSIGLLVVYAAHCLLPALKTLLTNKNHPTM